MHSCLEAFPRELSKGMTYISVLCLLLTSRKLSMADTGYSMMRKRNMYRLIQDNTKGPGEEIHMNVQY